MGAYKGDEAVAAGETFDPTPANLDARTQRFALPGGMKAALLPKKTRGGTVRFALRLRQGTEQSLMNVTPAGTLMASLLSRGTTKRDRQAYDDALDALRARVSIGGSETILTARGETVGANVAATLRLVAEALRTPALPAAELDKLKREMTTELAGSRSEPQAIAGRALARHDNPTRRATCATRPQSTRRSPAALRCEAPDKANAIALGDLGIPLRDLDPDYPLLMIAERILGGSSESRLSLRLREKEGLSYGVGTSLSPGLRSGGVASHRCWPRRRHPQRCMADASRRAPTAAVFVPTLALSSRDLPHSSSAACSRTSRGRRFRALPVRIPRVGRSKEITMTTSKWPYRVLAALALSGVALCATAKPQEATAEAVLEWNAIATEAMMAQAAAQPPGVPPYRESRIYAMAFVAMHDTLNAIQRRYQPYVCDAFEPGASPLAAVATAAHDVLVSAFPAQAARVAAAYAATLEDEHDSVRADAGIALGRRCAQAMLARRANDGADRSQVPYIPGDQPGDYRPTPPFDNPANPAYGFVGDPLWGGVTPFALASAAQFRSPPPYALASAAYAADVNEVKQRGAAVGSNRTPDESAIALFWRESSPLGWNRIARTLALAHGFDAWELARTFALLQVAEADAYLASLETKYYYDFWRPVTAIRLADTDGNGATTADPAWISFHPVAPPIPDYNSAHSAAGGAARAVLSRVLGRDDVAFSQTSTSLPGVVRNYASLTDAADENGLSRILVGYHFRHAVDAGRAQGESVGNWVVDHVLGPAR